MRRLNITLTFYKSPLSLDQSAEVKPEDLDLVSITKAAERTITSVSCMLIKME